MSELRYEKDSDHIATVTIDLSGHPADTIDQGFATSLEQTIDRLEKDDITGAILLLGKGSAFATGSMPKLQDTQQEKKLFFDQLSFVKQQLRRLEKTGKPVVAAINGTAVGLSCQISLAAHHRIAVTSSDSKIGLPEVSLGLLPGAGGIVRLVRLLGLEKALPLLMEGESLSPEKAQEAGLIDQLANNKEDLLAKARSWIKANAGAQQPWDRKGYKMPGGTPAAPGVAQMVFLAPAILWKKTKGQKPAAGAILSAAVEGAQVDLESALRIESRYAVELMFTEAR